MPDSEAPQDDTESKIDNVQLDQADMAEQSEEPESFRRDYVEQLRAEAKSWRVKAQKADGYAQRLHTEIVKATGRLADPTDMPFNEQHLTDPDALTTAIDALLVKKPHLASRRPIGDVGQGITGATPSVDLAALLRGGR